MHMRSASMILVLALGSTALAGKPENPTTMRSGAISAAEWKAASTAALKPGELDQLIAKEQQAANVKPAPRTTDEQFIRRVHLDVTGKLPQPAEVLAFVADADPSKRAKLIEKLLASSEFGSHWANYWSDTIAIRLTSFQGRPLQRHFNRWLAKSFNENRKWSDITRDILTFSGEARYDDEKAGPAFFLGSHMGADAVVEQAAETSRVFLGIQINCAQCHDHPFDVWKRQQFHEMAAYFARSRPRPIREENRNVGINLSGGGGFGGPGGRFGGGEHRMPDKGGDARQGGTVVHPKFIDGNSPRRGLNDKDRRNSLVASITSQENPWFAAAFVNRVWGELLGQSFYSPVDDLGPQKEAVFGAVLTRLAGAFRGSDYDVKGLYRVILNSEAYQRQSRTGVPGEHMQFAAVYPTRLRPPALWDSLQHVLGRIGDRGGFGGRPGLGGPGGRFGQGGIEGMIRTEFNFDPSLRAEDVEGSIPQALIFMNNPSVQERLKANGTNLLGRLLTANTTDAEALEKLYLQTLVRKPTEREQTRCLDHIRKAGSRTEAYEDILWALLNSTEFQTRR